MISWRIAIFLILLLSLVIAQDDNKQSETEFESIDSSEPTQKYECCELNRLCQGSLSAIECIYMYFLSTHDLDLTPSMPEPVAISYPDKSTHGLKVTIVGFTNDRSRGILRSLLSDVKDIGHPGLDSAKYQCVETSEGDILAISDEVNPLDNVSSDITFLYFNKMTLMNEDTAVQSVARALSSLMKSSEERSTKRSLIIILAGEVKDSEGMYNKTITYMDIAKEIVAENILAAGTLTSSIDTRVIVAPTVDVSKTASNMIKELISKLAVDGKLIESLYPDTNRTAAKVKPQKEILKREVIVGVGQLQDEVRESILVAQKALRDSLQKLLKSESATEFPTFLENLQTLCVNKMRKKAADKKITNKFILQCAEDEIRRDIFAISSNIFKNHVRVLQQQSIENFNKAAIDILENISVFMARDLQKARNKAVASFRAGIRKLTPKNAPVNWNCNFEVLKLEELIDAYIEERKVLARIDGILPRGRPPLELSFHVFLSHPTGRDYRQDVITGLAGDEPVYDSNIAKSGDILVKPSLARGILKQQLEENSHYGSLTKRDSEFAREMLMFPLSIKNPGVRLISAKGRRRVVAPKKDTTRADLGPERFIFWDISPLDEVKKNLDAVQSAYARNKKTSPFDTIINLLPPMKNAFYDSPPLVYGSKYAPSKSS